MIVFYIFELKIINHIKYIFSLITNNDWKLNVGDRRTSIKKKVDKQEFR